MTKAAANMKQHKNFSFIFYFLSTYISNKTLLVILSHRKAEAVTC